MGWDRKVGRPLRREGFTLDTPLDDGYLERMQDDLRVGPPLYDSYCLKCGQAFNDRDGHVCPHEVDDREWCRAFIDHNCIYRSPPGELILNSVDGGVNAWQFYLPIAILNQEFAERVSRLFWQRYGEQYLAGRFQLCDCESGGSLLVSVLQASTDRPYPTSIPAFMIKKAAKSYGLKNWLEGVVDPDLPVLLIDDVVGGGDTMMNAAFKLLEFGLKICGAWTIVGAKRETPLEMHLGPEKTQIVVDMLYKGRDFARMHGEYHAKYGKEPAFQGSTL